jgi:hypothetical protein
LTVDAGGKLEKVLAAKKLTADGLMASSSEHVDGDDRGEVVSEPGSPSWTRIRNGDFKTRWGFRSGKSTELLDKTRFRSRCCLSASAGLEDESLFEEALI